MPRGKPVRALSQEQIARLETFRKAPHRGHPHGYSFTGLRKAMGASFRPETLTKALAGLPVYELHHNYIAQWIARFLDEKPSEGAAPLSTLSAPSSSQRHAELPRGAASEEVAESAETDEALDEDERHEKKTGATGTIRGSR
jgi:hypothetical protein